MTTFSHRACGTALLCLSGAILLGLGGVLAFLALLGPRTIVHAATPASVMTSPGFLTEFPGTTAGQEQLDVSGLDPNAAWTATGENGGDYFGRAFPAGDVNGDGLSDVIVGAYGYMTNTGRAYLYFGTSDGLTTSIALTLTGANEGDRLGQFAAAGDVNGDGFADLLIGAPGYLTNTGRAYLYLGAATGLEATPVLTLTGENESDYFGRVAPAGDVNGDGYSDILIAAHNYPSGTSDGLVYLYYGSAAGLSSTPALTLTGSSGETLGISLNTAGDVNGDGYGDVIIGATKYNGGRGAAYIYHGSAAGLSATPALTLTGEAGNDRFGTSVSTAGDVNGDGYADVVIGAEYFTTGWQEGRVYVYLGGAGGVSSTPVFHVTGENSMSYLGGAVSTAGDVNGDGYADVVIGARGYPNNNRQGKVYLYLGGPGGPDTTADFTAVGESNGDYLGTTVATAGDVDGDGFSDLLLGAPGYGSNQGRAYLYLGGGDILNNTPAWTATGENANDIASLTFPAGDVNGDGFSDVIIGAPGYLTNTGRAYLYLGASDGLTTTVALTLDGQSEDDYFGISVAAGDVNGDGFSDVIIGAHFYQTETGRAYLYLGSATGLGATPVLTLSGENEDDRFGYRATAGDVDGDGYSDILIAASNYPSGTNDGRVYLYYGSANGLSSTPALTLTGSGAEQLGASLSTAGDVNGDGYGDVIIGASTHGGGRGAAYIYHGSAAGLSATPALTLTGEAGNDRFGTSVSTAGDVNGDGYADVVIGAEYFTTGWQEGRVYVYLGGAGGVSSTPVFHVTGENSMSYLGGAVSTAGDVNGDGYADVVIGARGYPNNNRQGKVYLYLGGPGGPDTTADFTAVGETSGNLFGHSVATAGDVDGDGYADLLVGALYYNSKHGRAYLYTNGAGRTVLPRQLRDDTSGLPVQPWGLPHSHNTFLLRLNAISPLGRTGVRLQSEACPPATPFGDAACVSQLTPGWTDVTSSANGIPFTTTVSGLDADTTYRWRARLVYDSLYLPYSPWRRLFGQGMEADLRVGTPPDVTVYKSVTPDIVGPGQTVTYTLSFSNVGSLVATDVTVADQITTLLTNLAYWSNRPVTASGTFSYAWQVGDLAGGEGGVITVTGVVTSAASGEFDLVNQAEIGTSAAEIDLSNNTSVVTSAVDAEPPQVVMTVPPDGAVDVPTSVWITIAFTEPIDAATLDFTAQPDPGGWIQTWNPAYTATVLMHNPFGYGQQVTVTVNAADDIVGNHLLDAPYTWHFTTRYYRVLLPLVMRSYP